MTRRHALKTIAASGAIAAFSGINKTAIAQETPKPSGAISFKHSACRWCYGNLPLEKFAIEGKKIGLQSIELLNPDEWRIVQKNGLECAVANGPSSIGDGFNRRENHAKYIPAFIERLELCAKEGIPNVICFSGNRRGQSDEEGLEICAEGLRKLTPVAEKLGVTLIMELLNSKVNHGDYQCDHTAWGVELCKRVGSERFKLLYDIYHMQVQEGDVIRNIRDFHKYIGHYHTAGNPGRNEFEPRDPQELNYPAIMKAIHDTGFRGYIGQEFSPTRDPLTSLANAIKICTVA